MPFPASSLHEIAELAGGQVIGDGASSVAGISTDSRTIQPGQLFVALPGERFDGHDFIEQVWARGAAVLAHRLPAQGTGPAVLVDQSLEALQRWAMRDLQRRPARVVGITGSVGKTSIKEMIGAVLGTAYRVHRTRQNLNGQIGVALTILERAPDTQVLVLEMGISLPGEMERLIQMAPPELAVLSKLSQVHQENFSSFERLVEEKGKIFARGPDLALVHAEVWPRLGLAPGRARTYGSTADAEVRVSGVGVERWGTGEPPLGLCTVHGIGPAPMAVRLPYLGRAMAENAACALAAGAAFGVGARDMLQALSTFRIEAPMRQEWHQAGGVAWINDAYNASPASMLSALELLALGECRGRKIAVLGDMLELGEESESLHRGLAAAVSGVADRLFTFGRRMRALAEAVTIPAEAFEDMPQLTRRLLETVRPGDLLLFKGSRGMRMERPAQELGRQLEREHQG